MKEKSFVKLEASQSFLVESSLAPHLNTFVSLLIEHGYTKTTMDRKLWLVGKLNQWFSQQFLRVEELSEQKLDRFIEFQGVKGATRRGDRATLILLLRHLENLGIVPSSSKKTEDSGLDRIEKDFIQYLSRERGLSQATLVRYPAMVRRFLAEHFDRKPVQLETLRASDVTRFMLGYVPTVKRGTARLMATCLCSFFRCLHLRGIIGIDLAEFVPAVADWRMSDIPKFLEPEEVQLLLDHCDQGSKTGQRDYAILLLLARLGLRAGEVTRMKLDDINWESGEIVIRGKGPHMDRFPLPHDVGTALATYLQGRPMCSTRRIFVRIRAPHEGFSSSVAVCSLVQRALSRANLHPTHKGAHLLRHSLAKKMLDRGASLVEIGEVLRHRLVSTTEIYAKVDMSALQSLAQPWPGGDV
ncbi:MAG: tyrosine-type recombinase/integrase [Proteobacteria bacterium]|nr:tyrosine-type recombinase/integrase [Pseudomonadota bacterium]